jgi:hypothetical protein
MFSYIVIIKETGLDSCGKAHTSAPRHRGKTLGVKQNKIWHTPMQLVVAVAFERVGVAGIRTSQIQHHPSQGLPCPLLGSAHMLVGTALTNSADSACILQFVRFLSINRQNSDSARDLNFTTPQSFLTLLSGRHRDLYH